MNCLEQKKIQGLKAGNTKMNEQTGDVLFQSIKEHLPFQSERRNFEELKKQWKMKKELYHKNNYFSRIQEAVFKLENLK